MGEDYKKGGNSALFGFYLLANIALTVFGLLLISFGIYSCEKGKDFNEHNGSFIMIGVFIEVICFVGHLMRYSPYYLFIYAVSLLVAFVLMIIFVGISFRKLEVESEDLPFFRFILLQTLLNIVICLALALWYWRTLETANKVTVCETTQPKVSPFLKH